jgi:hypothetical protein
MQSLERGDFCASTGVVLDNRVQFIGRGGQILTEVTEPSATYSFRGDEGYVRAKVIESNGRMAWVQPVWVPNRPSSASVGWATPLIIAGLVGYRAREFRRRDRDV